MADSGGLGALLFLPRQMFKAVVVVVQVAFLVWFCYAAYDIRLYPIKDFGMVIHEFDPWFNYRATEYLAENGLAKFFKWYDYESWYPLGRPVGTTIYPGMQMTAVAIWEGMKKVGSFTFEVPSIVLLMNQLLGMMKSAGFAFVPTIPPSMSFAPMSVNDICCMMPPWFGTIASIFTGLLAYEISRSVNAGLITTGIMAVIPAHLMRSVGGEFDNEAVAVAAIVSTFWLWIRSVRSPKSWPWGVFAGMSYAYAAAAWGGGPIFVLNMVGVHALMLVGLGRFNSGVHKAYTLFWIIGTAGAIQIPVIGWQPIRSLEQLGPMLVFMGYQVLAFCDWRRRSSQMGTEEFVRFRIKVMAVFLGVLIVGVIILWPTGYFGPLSSRIRGLFVKHTKTGNPLVDSVAEHQPASSGMYVSYLNLPLDYAVLGGLVSLRKRNNGFYFMMLYAFIAHHFSGKMSRLVLICGPIVSVACGIWCGFLMDLLMEPFFLLLGKKPDRPTVLQEEPAKEAEKDEAPSPPVKGAAKAGGKASKERGSKGKDSGKSAKSSKKVAKKEVIYELEEWEEEVRPGGAMQLKRILKDNFDGIPEDIAALYPPNMPEYHKLSGISLRAVISVLVILYTLTLGSTIPKVYQFVKHCDNVAQSLSNPQVVFHYRDRAGRKVLVDDYLKGYQWIDENTPKDARVMAWWDYGYQITGIGRRTSLADGNTWNHEHIATIGKTLTSPEKKAWNTIRHLADYVLVWAGGHGDDLAKSPHLARIGNSVFPDHCGDDDPKCNRFGFFSDESPTPMMAKSLLYKLVANGVKPGVTVSEALFQEVHTTQNGLMRIYKVQNISEESKAWIADPNNRVCDAPGSWYCVGQYPPALEKLISRRINFAQLEDFNKGTASKSAYTRMIEKERAGAKGEL